jgi:hypothetical protein
MKKISTVAAKQRKNFCGQKLTIGLDLGDRWSWYCLLGEAGEVLQEQKLGTTPKAMKEVFGGMPRSRIALEMGMHSPWLSRVLSELGHEVIVAHARNARLIGESRLCLGIDRWLCFFRMTFCGICHPCGLVAHPPQRTRKGGAPSFSMRVRVVLQMGGSSVEILRWESGLCRGSRCVRMAAYVVRSVRGRGRPRHRSLTS